MSSTNTKEKPSHEEPAGSLISSIQVFNTSHEVKSMSCGGNAKPIGLVTSTSSPIAFHHPRPTINDSDAIREYRRVRVAACRAKKARIIEDLQDAINANRAILDLPPQDFTKKKSSRKGKARPKYEPPPEMMAKMSKAEITAWKLAERKKRRNEKGRRDKEREDELVQSLKIELLDLEREVRKMNKEPYVIPSTSKQKDLKKISIAQPVNCQKPKAKAVSREEPVRLKSSTTDEASMKLVKARGELCKLSEVASENLGTTTEKKPSNKAEDATTKPPSSATKDVVAFEESAKSSDLDYSTIDVSPGKTCSSNEPVFDDIAVAFPDVIPSNREGADLTGNIKSMAEQQDIQGIEHVSAPSDMYENDDISVISSMNFIVDSENAVDNNEHGPAATSLNVCTGTASDQREYIKPVMRQVSMEPAANALFPANNPNAFIPDPVIADGYTSDVMTHVGYSDFIDNDDALSIEELVFDEIVITQDDPFLDHPLVGLEN
ncbi:hypothetical protein ACHAWO_002442 [Cyclotella atomus]|uniref:Uncharacterized protein n=1 Tax=Cyclotella atomus TaxID=382360 RepID=A0ABD3QP94_9STRA